MIAYSVKHIPWVNFKTSGDNCIVLDTSEHLYLAVIDIAGHGSHKCYQTAIQVKEMLQDSLPQHSLAESLEKSHKKLIGSGAAILVISINKETGSFQYSSVGNISIKKISYPEMKIKKLLSQDGMLGYALPQKIRLVKGNLKHNDFLFIHTDGVKSTSNILKYFSFSEDIHKISRMIVKHERNRDDALGLLVRYDDE